MSTQDDKLHRALDLFSALQPRDELKSRRSRQQTELEGQLKQRTKRKARASDQTTGIDEYLKDSNDVAVGENTIENELVNATLFSIRTRDQKADSFRTRYGNLVEKINNATPSHKLFIERINHPAFRTPTVSSAKNAVSIPTPDEFKPFLQRIKDAQWASHLLPLPGAALNARSWEPRVYALVMQSYYPCQLCKQMVSLGEGTIQQTCPFGQIQGVLPDPGAPLGRRVCVMTTTHAVTNEHVKAWNLVCNIFNFSSQHLGPSYPLTSADRELLETQWGTAVPLMFVASPALSSQTDGRAIDLLFVQPASRPACPDKEDVWVPTPAQFTATWVPESLKTLSAACFSQADGRTAHSHWRGGGDDDDPMSVDDLGGGGGEQGLKIDLLEVYKTRVLETATLTGDAENDKKWTGKTQVLVAPRRSRTLPFIPFVYITRFKCT